MLNFHALRVAAIAPNAEDAVALEFEVPAALKAAFAGQPGQHVVLRTLIRGNEVRRTYSLVNLPGETTLRIVARVHEHGLMSRYLANELKVGECLDVLPPNGSLTPRAPFAATPANSAPGQHYVAFAAGCGITPILALASSLLAANPANRFTLFYGNSGTARTMCLESLQQLKNRYLARLALHFLMSREPQEVQVYNGRLDAARIDEFARVFFRPADVAQFFLCGPGDMNEVLGSALGRLGVSPDRIHSEHFKVAAEAGGQGVADAGTGVSAPPQTSDVPSGALPQEHAQVTVLMDGRRRTFTMRMNSETVLDAAGSAGLELPFSCRAGVCSTCRTKVIRGEVQMAENYALEDWELEQGYVLACQSRVMSRELELDYDER